MNSFEKSIVDIFRTFRKDLEEIRDAINVKIKPKKLPKPKILKPKNRRKGHHEH